MYGFYHGIPAIYSPRPTLGELLAETPNALDGINLPGCLSSSTLSALIVRECGELQTLYRDGPSLAAHLPLWSSMLLPGWTRAYEALQAQYNPIHNYDRTETETESVEHEATAGGTTSTTTENTRNDSSEHGVQGFNATDYAASDQDTGEITDSGTGSAETTSESTSSESRTRSTNVSGNIGVTTSQQMVQAELELRSEWTIYGIILEAFKRDLCVEVY